MHADDELFIPRRTRCGLSLVLLHKISKKRSQCVAPGGKHERVLVAEIAVQRRRRQAGRLGDAADGRRGDAVRDEQRLRRVDHPPDVLFPFLTAFHGLHLPAQSCLQYAMFSRRLQPQMCRVETFVPCTARRSVVCSRQTRDSSPPERMSWPRRKSGSFFMTGFTGHKKDPISFEAGLAPSSSPATLYPFPCRILTIDSKKSPLPRQRALRLGCSVLADGSRIRRPSSPWPALRVPCCPRRRGQWQG